MSRYLLIIAMLIPAPTRAGDLDTALGRMVTTTGTTYVNARAHTISLGADQLRARVSDAQWSAASWELDAMAAVALAWSERPERCDPIYALDGLNPSVYLARRRLGPEVGRELRRHRDVAPVLFEALAKALHHFSTTRDFPPQFRPHADELIAAERAALRVGLIAALGRSGHPVAPWVLEGVVTNTMAPEGERRAAAIALGEAAGVAATSPVAVLTSLAADGGLSAWLRGGAVIGIGKAARAHPRASVEAVRGFLIDPALRRAAISALALAGSSWGPASAELRAEIAVLLTAELRDAVAHEQALMEALTVVNHPAATERLERMQQHGKPAARARAVRALDRMRRAAEP